MADSTNKFPLEVKSFRLILSDALVQDGQKVKTFNLSKSEIDSITVESVVARLNEHFDFAELVAERKVNPEALKAGTGGLSMMGNDGSRHVPIRNDEQLVTFFNTVVNSRLPSLEVKISQSGGPLAKSGAGPSQPAATRRSAGDRVEELEDLNFKISKATQQLQKSVAELERSSVADREEAQRICTLTSKDLTQKVESVQQVVYNEAKQMTEANEGLNVENEQIRKSIKELEQRLNLKIEQVVHDLEMKNTATLLKFDGVAAEIETLKSTDDELKDEDERQGVELKKVNDELRRIDDAKVQKTIWQSAQDELNKRLNQEMTDMKKKLDDTENFLRDQMTKQKDDIMSVNQTLRDDVKATTDRLDGELQKMDVSVKTGISTISDNLGKIKVDLSEMLKTEVNSLAESSDKRFADVKATFEENKTSMAERLSELNLKTEGTFTGMELRMDNLVKAERSRLGNIERDLSEGTAKLRSDCRAEVERVRVDYEQEAARLDGDLSDLHMKSDVIKQEINFFQSRLLEQRDWAQRQIAETATATRAAQVDAQEGVAAATKMAHALRDDQVSFRDKMAKHISLLQHASDSYGDAINALETQRSRMRLELDAVLGDHKAYVTDMDGWADDVRVKVERLFRAMEPPRCEWRIDSAIAKFKDLKKPLAMRSPTFALQGLREVQLELYPHGHTHSPDGKAVLRICMPPNANVRYQCWLGKLTEGSREYESGGSLSVDLLFDGWKEELLDDGALILTMEILQDLTNNDESLARAVHLEC